jgi:RNA polymerase sigma-70 factor (ECF subfamily)
MLFQAARFPSRTDTCGELLIPEEQDRSLWTNPRSRALYSSPNGRGQRLTPSHLQPEIGAVHACASRFDQTDWGHILSAYDLLAEIQPSPVILVNRAVAIAQEAGLAALALAEIDR